MLILRGRHQRQEVSGSLQSTIVVLAELGMLYRRVYNYVRITQASAGVSLGSGGMTEQVSAEERTS